MQGMGRSRLGRKAAACDGEQSFRNPGLSQYNHQIQVVLGR
jgi:hypothetical protein